MSQPNLAIFTPLELEVLEYTKQWHGEQQRKYTNEPYWYHLVNVATLVKEYKGNQAMVMAAFLHDVLEDTQCQHFDLYCFLADKYGLELSYSVCAMVSDLTDYYTSEFFPQHNRKKRKELESKRLGSILPESQTIKYCDLIDNTSSIVAHDPKFAKVYLQEKEQMLTSMTQGDPELWIRAWNVLKLNREEV